MDTFENVVLPHQDFLRNSAFKMCNGDIDLVDDMVQETMVRALGAWHRLDLRVNIKTWLYTILRNTILTTTRKRPIKWHQWPEEYDVADKRPSGDVSQLLELINRVLNDRPERDKQIFELSIDGHTNRAIAKEVGLTGERVRQILAAIRTELADHLYKHN